MRGLAFISAVLTCVQYGQMANDSVRPLGFNSDAANEVGVVSPRQPLPVSTSRLMLILMLLVTQAKAFLARVFVPELVEGLTTVLIRDYVRLRQADLRAWKAEPEVGGQG